MRTPGSPTTFVSGRGNRSRSFNFKVPLASVRVRFASCNQPISLHVALPDTLAADSFRAEDGGRRNDAPLHWVHDVWADLIDGLFAPLDHRQTIWSGTSVERICLIVPADTSEEAGHDCCVLERRATTLSPSPRRSPVGAIAPPCGIPLCPMFRTVCDHSATNLSASSR